MLPSVETPGDPRTISGPDTATMCSHRTVEESLALSTTT